MDLNGNWKVVQDWVEKCVCMICSILFYYYIYTILLHWRLFGKDSSNEKLDFSRLNSLS